jgi:hypothetical protein
MEKEFVPYELALALKELGFDEPCFATFYRKELSQYPSSREEETGFNATPFKLVKNTEVVGLIADTITAPTYSQCFRWFREKYSIECSIFIVEEKNKYSGSLKGNKIKDFKHFGFIDFYDTYEEAELECLKKLIEIVKEKQL